MHYDHETIATLQRSAHQISHDEHVPGADGRHDGRVHEVELVWHNVRVHVHPHQCKMRHGCNMARGQMCG